MTELELHRTQRILAPVESPNVEVPELDWIENRVRLLGENFGVARHAVQSMIECGILFVVREDLIE